MVSLGVREEIVDVEVGGCISKALFNKVDEYRISDGIASNCMVMGHWSTDILFRGAGGFTA